MKEPDMASRHFVTRYLLAALACLPALAQTPAVEALRPDLAAIASDLAAAQCRLNQAVDANPQRDKALARFDQIMTSEFPNRFTTSPPRPESLAALQDFYQYQIARAVGEMKSPAYAGKVRFWNIYSCGYVVRDGDALFAFDLTKPPALHPDRDFPEWDWLLDNLDVAFYSHPHGDHYDKDVAERIRAGKGALVVTWEDKESGPHTWNDVKYFIHPGAQGLAPNNNYEVVAPSGAVFYHTGDQTEAETVKCVNHVDVLFSGYENLEYMLAPAPRAVVPSHLYELSHCGGGRLTRYAPPHNFYQYITHAGNFLVWGEGVTVVPGAIPPPPVAFEANDGARPSLGRLNPKLGMLFNRIPGAYADLSAALLDNPSVVDPLAPYQRRRMQILDTFDRLIEASFPAFPDASTAPSAADFEKLRRMYAFWVAKAIEEILTASDDAEGVQFWNFYRGGWVVKEGPMIFAVNLRFPHFMDPIDSPAPTKELLDRLRALFICATWSNVDLDDKVVAAASANPDTEVILAPVERTGGEIDGLKWEAFPGEHVIHCPVPYPNTQYVITTPKGVVLYFPGDQTDVMTFPKDTPPVIDVGFVGYNHYDSVPELPYSLEPVPKVMVPDHFYDFTAHFWTGRLGRREPMWHTFALDELLHHQLLWGESFTYVRPAP